MWPDSRSSVAQQFVMSKSIVIHLLMEICKITAPPPQLIFGCDTMHHHCVVERRHGPIWQNIYDFHLMVCSDRAWSLVLCTYRQESMGLSACLSFPSTQMVNNTDTFIRNVLHLKWNSYVFLQQHFWRTTSCIWLQTTQFWDMRRKAECSEVLIIVKIWQRVGNPLCLGETLCGTCPWRSGQWMHRLICSREPRDPTRGYLL